MPTEVIDIIDRYLAALKRHNIPIQQAVLFGSYANGHYDEWSDIDLALVSEVFEGIRIRDRSKIRAITLSVSSDLEVLPYRPGDFTPEDPFVKEILE
ncbi:MAG: nucleotidyltransferase domain-containing protein, partial [Candidatus Latescibacteria bacterium]|nr:nucleotidyltransferase domain-containing protein [Candidatus Latescibacterota bacterium]